MNGTDWMDIYSNDVYAVTPGTRSDITFTNF